MDKGAKAARVADSIRDHVAAWIHQDIPGCFVSVAHVQLSPTLQKATIWVEPFSGERVFIASQLKRLQPHYQQRLHQTLIRRFVPTIEMRLVEEAIPADSL